MASHQYDPSGSDDQPVDERRQTARGSATRVTQRHEPDGQAERAERELLRRERYGGFNWGADVSGWLVAVAIAILMSGIVAAVAAAAGSAISITQDTAEREAGSIGVGTGIALLLVLMLGYFTGGYVAGRMSRYDGGRQGAGVWLIGLLVTVLVTIVGTVFGTHYDPLRRVDLPALPLPTETATIGALIALAAILVGTLLAAVLGGKVGRRYHTKVDRVGA